MFKDEIIWEIIDIIKRKHKICLSQIEKYPNIEYYKSYVTSQCYLDEIIWEIEEVRNENRENNSIYLEDELWDILWGYINLLYFLENEGKIQANNVIKCCLKKYDERTKALENNISWDDIKKKQKKDLLEEHKKRYET